MDNNEVKQESKKARNTCWCGKYARDKTGLCKGHGGGKRCSGKLENGQPCPNGAKGKTDFCKGHGGGNRCEELCCIPLTVPNMGKFKHPDHPKKYICTGAARHLVYSAWVDNDIERFEFLKAHFGFKKDLILRAEHAFYFELVKQEPRLATLMYRALDESISTSLEGKQKSLQNLRPDYFHLYPPTNMALYGEFDETDDHEDDDDRLAQITNEAGCGLERTYIFRVRAKLYTPDALLKRSIINKSTTYYRMTPRGHEVLHQVVYHVRQCIDNIISGILPNEMNQKVHF